MQPQTETHLGPALPQTHSVCSSPLGQSHPEEAAMSTLPSHCLPSHSLAWAWVDTLTEAIVPEDTALLAPFAGSLV